MAWFVRRELDLDFLARVGLPAGKSRTRGQLRAEQQVARRARGQTAVIERLHEDARLALVQPVVQLRTGKPSKMRAFDLRSRNCWISLC